MSYDKEIIKFKLVYEGGAADDHRVDLYDVSQALIGFQRSIALTSHLIINREIITKATSLKGAQILANPSDKGSWEIVAIIIAIGVAPKNTPLGHIVHSAYDYIVFRSLGFHVDYNKTLGELIKQHQIGSLEEDLGSLEEDLNFLIGKCKKAFIDMHRPIFKTKTAKTGKIISSIGGKERNVGLSFNEETYQYMREGYIHKEEIIRGLILSYNSETYKGKIFVGAEGSMVTFELKRSCRGDDVVRLITASLAANAVEAYDNKSSEVCCRVLKSTTRSGELKNYKIIEVSHVAPNSD